MSPVELIHEIPFAVFIILTANPFNITNRKAFMIIHTVSK